MTDVIRIHHADTDEEAERRQKEMFARLEHLGVDEVRAMMARDDFAPALAPIIRGWLKGKYGNA